MPSLVNLLPEALVFALVVARVGGMALTAPLYSAVAVPQQVRVAVVFVLALVLTPAQFGTAAIPTQSAAAYALAAGGEVLVGMGLGLGAAVLLSAARLVGHLISQASGLSLAELFDPETGGDTPALGQFLGAFTLVIYLAVGGHRLLVSGLLDTFSTMPLGQTHLAQSMVTTLVTLVTESYSLALRSAAPPLLALVMATIILGMIGRTLPHLNILTLGFGVNTIVALVALSAALGSVAWLFEDQVPSAITMAVRSLSAAPIGVPAAAAAAP